MEDLSDAEFDGIGFAELPDEAAQYDQKLAVEHSAERYAENAKRTPNPPLPVSLPPEKGEEGT